LLGIVQPNYFAQDHHHLMKNLADNPWINIGLNVVAPSLILSKLSDPDRLGQITALVLALSLPLAHGLYGFYKTRKANFFSIVGLVSVLLTGGIGLVAPSKEWMIAKEAGVPLLLGFGVAYSERTKKPLVKMFLNQVLRLDDVEIAFAEAGKKGDFTKHMRRSSWMLAGSFVVSSVLNFALAIAVLEGGPGSVEFNQSLGKMTALSFPVIAIPMMVIVVAIMLSLFKSIKEATSRDVESFLRQ
jgi:hypothetical protein